MKGESHCNGHGYSCTGRGNYYYCQHVALVRAEDAPPLPECLVRDIHINFVFTMVLHRGRELVVNGEAKLCLFS